MNLGQMTVSYTINGRYVSFETYFPEFVMGALKRIGINAYVTPF